MIDATTQQAQRGDKTAQATLLRQLQDPWYRFCMSMLRDPERARDATQETGLRFLKLLPRFAGSSTLSTWSMGIAINVCRELRRDAGKHNVVDADNGRMRLASERSAPLASAALSEHKSLLRASLDDLPERQREAVVLRFFEDLSVEETAAAMNCAAGTVKATVHQALKALKHKLKQLS